MKKRTVYQVDAFTKEKFKGNPAGVVLNAEGMTSGQMQLIARELNNSETAFLFPSYGGDHDGKIRYFTPTTEVPICGHATIAALYAKAKEEQLDSCILKMKTTVGILPIEIIKQAGDYQIVMEQGRFQLYPPLDAFIAQRILSAFGLDKTDLEEKCPIQIASTGHSKVIIGIRSRSKLNQLKPDMISLAEISPAIQCNGYFVFTFDSISSEVLTYGRMFAPAIGIMEDPVTGNANGPLGGYLVDNGIVQHKGRYFEFVGRQGEIMNRMGEMQVSVNIENNRTTSIQIKGNAVIVFQTEIEI
ncbi:MULTISPECIES: PhzF family isomerase [Flavobacteriaceae]|uniref:PhzF family isomerase n=1 Tax=Flavobacteriaceae TaxID=49546 RepID=UPI002349AA26|nr:PhzF family isomerase [Muricauda sp. SP22]MDC6362622.1 PhzF family isomerase [Muricauda sp. SP22]